MSADNQQGSLDEKLCNYLAGFVDGEGTFHVGIHKRNQVKIGWQVYCEFHVSQNYDKVSILKEMRKVLGCGYIKPNHRNSNDKTYVLVVRNQQDLLSRVIPFFERYPFRSPKQRDFEKFARVVKMVEKQKHLKKKGLLEIAKIAFSWYRKVYSVYHCENCTLRLLPKAIFLGHRKVYCSKSLPRLISMHFGKVNSSCSPKEPAESSGRRPVS